MEQKKLIELYKTKDLNQIDLTTSSKYFATAKEFYKDLQDGVASPLNFFENTIVTYTETGKRPNRKPDFTSDSGSMYWYTKDGVTRGSNHWGKKVANCDWALKRLNGRTVYGKVWGRLTQFKEYKYAFAKWTDFEYKAKIVDIEGKEVLETFNNVEGRSLVRVGKNLYQGRMVEVFEKVK